LRITPARSCSLTLAGSALAALRKLWVICRFFQNSADVLKNVPSRIAV